MTILFKDGQSFASIFFIIRWGFILFGTIIETFFIIIISQRMLSLASFPILSINYLHLFLPTCMIILQWVDILQKYFYPQIIQAINFEYD